MKRRVLGLCCLAFLLATARPAWAQYQPPLDPRFQEVTNLQGTFSYGSWGLLNRGAFYPNYPTQFMPPVIQGTPAGGPMVLQFPTTQSGFRVLALWAVEVELPGADVLNLSVIGRVFDGDRTVGKCRGFYIDAGAQWYDQPHVSAWFQYSSPGLKTITMTAYACQTDASGAAYKTATVAARATWSFHVAPSQPPPSLRVRASVSGGTPVPTQGAALPATARVPLGAVLDLVTTDQAGQLLPASFALNVATVAPGVAPRAIFKDKALVRYSSGGLNTAQFVATHKGTVTITVHPADVSIAPGTLTVLVEDPLRLGTTGNDVDQDVYRVAHRYGVPPQFVKAHAHKESGARFNRAAYRYEPIGPWAGDLKRVSREDNLRVQLPFSNFRLATKKDELNDKLPVGPLLSDTDRNVRDVLRIECKADGSSGRPIEPEDEEVSAQEIFRCNDARMNWTSKAGDAGPARVRSLMAHPFTAQTSLAASFGLLQVTYVGAIRDIQWPGDKDGQKNPALLLDTAESHGRHAGSLDAGTYKVQKDFKNAVVESQITSHERLIAAFVKALHRYNPGEGNYGGSVAVRVPLFLPVAAAPVLGGSQ